MMEHLIGKLNFSMIKNIILRKSCYVVSLVYLAWTIGIPSFIYRMTQRG